MNKAKSIEIIRYNKYLDKTIIILAVLTIALVVVIYYLWAHYVPNSKKSSMILEYTDKRDPTTSDSTNVSSGNLQSNTSPDSSNFQNFENAGLRQFCSLSDNTDAPNNGEDNSFQKCASGLVCTPNILVNGPICLADIGSACNNLSDCVPEADICLNGECSLVDNVNKINTICRSDADCNLNVFEDNINNHFCFKLAGQEVGLCKVNLFPFDGGCQTNSQCPDPEGTAKIIRCVKQNNFDTVLMTGDLICNKDICSDGEGLSLKLDQKFNLNYLIDSSQSFMLRLVTQNSNIIDTTAQIPFVINGVSNLTNTISLSPLEFHNYDSLESGKVSFYFGDYPTNTNLPYGVCLELLPLGSPADYKFGGVSIPPTDIVTHSVVDGIFINGSRNSPGALNNICLNDAPEGSVLSCGTTKFLGQQWKLSCGYNYELEEIYLDNFYYGLSPGGFKIENLGNCMIKSRGKNRPCNNSTEGCFDPFNCMPISLPGSTNISNYCIAPFRAQIPDNNNCPIGYTPSGLTICKSNKGNLSFTDTGSDCINNIKLTNNDVSVYFYSLEADEYFKLDFSINEFNVVFPSFESGKFLENLVVKLSKSYTTVENYPKLNITKKTRLPTSILVYENTDKGWIILTIQEGEYKPSSSGKLSCGQNLSVHSLHLDANDNLAIVQKRTSVAESREIAFKIVDIVSQGEYVYLALDSPSNWYILNILRQNTTYEVYFSTTDLQLKQFTTSSGSGILYLIQSNTVFNGLEYNDLIAIETGTWQDADDLATEFASNSTSISEKNLLIVFNTNLYAFNNGIYDAGGSPVTELQAGEQNPYLPPDSSNLNLLGQNFFTLPLVYRNNGTVLEPNFINNFTPLENGDAIKFSDNFKFFNIEENVNESGIVTITEGTTLYIEKLQRNYYLLNDNSKFINLDNYIINLHGDFLSSQGSVPIFDVFNQGNQGDTVNMPVYNQNFYKNSIDTNDNNIISPVNFVFNPDMENYNVTFIKSSDLTSLNMEITLSPSKKFIAIQNQNSQYPAMITNGLNNSISYNFSEGTSISFDFYSDNNDNYIMIKSAVQGENSYHNYIQKIKYNLEFGNDNFSVAGDTYTNFFQSSYGLAGTDTYNNISFSYINNIIAPKPKSLYYNNNINVNTIDSVQENLFDTDTNSISIFSTFNNEEFIKKSGYVPSDDFDINNSSVYSNKAPPVASYSRLNNYAVEKDEDKLNVKYSGLNFVNDQTFNYLELEDGISLSFNHDNNCLGRLKLNDDTSFITLRDPEIIDLFLSNPSSEIVLQKDGDSIEDFYITKGVSSVLYGADLASKTIFNPNDNSSNYNLNGWYGGRQNPFDYKPNYTGDIVSPEKFTTFIQINRSVKSIEEYDVEVDSNGNVSEYMVILLNANIDTNDNYILNIFQNSSKWKFWHNNFVPLSYINLYNYVAYSYEDNVYITRNTVNADENLITILDGSPLWCGSKSSSFTFSTDYTSSSFNKLLLVDDNEVFNVFNVHDGYFRKLEDVFKGNNLVNENFTFTTVGDIANFNTMGDYIESIIPIETITATAIAPPAFINTIFELTKSEKYNYLSSASSINLLRPFTRNISNYQLAIDPSDYILNLHKSKSLPSKIPIFSVKNINNKYNTIEPFNVKTYLFEDRNINVLKDGFAVQAGFVIGPLEKTVGSTFPSLIYKNENFVYFKKNYLQTLPVIDISIFNYNSGDNLKTVFDTVYNTNFLNLYGNNHSNVTNYLTSVENSNRDVEFGSQIESNIITSTNANSFIPFLPNTQEYKNNKNIIILNNDIGDFGNGLLTTLKFKGYYEIAFVCNLRDENGDSTTGYNFIANLEMRPVNSSSICLPDKYANYSKTLYMISDLFLSNLPKQVDSFLHIGLNILEDYIISNIYYDSNGNKKYKGLGLIKFKIDAEAIFSNNKEVANLYNLINYNTVRIPQDFTERFVSRLNSIPIVKRVFVNIAEGNIYDNLNYYLYLSYSTIEDSDTQDVNDGILYMSTNTNINTILENRGVAYTPSLTDGDIDTEILSNIVTFEPYNKFLITLGYSCG